MVKRQSYIVELPKVIWSRMMYQRTTADYIRIRETDD